MLRSTLADANEVGDWRIHAEFTQSLIGVVRPLYAAEPFGVDLRETVYVLDASTIELCLSVFPWAPLSSTKAAIKLHKLGQYEHEAIEWDEIRRVLPGLIAVHRLMFV